MEKKVSIITPCYNGEKFVSRYLISILHQTYKNIELILIDDGSTDKTSSLVKKFIPKFEEKGKKLIYIYQENSGQAAALNKGLKLFTGDYLTWPDSDDILAYDSIEKKVKFLENYKKYDIVRTDAYKVYENNIEKVVGKFGENDPNKYKEDLFDDFILEKTWLCNGCYMIRTSSFEKINPKKEIFLSNGGQNWQIILPMAYYYKFGYIDEPLYTYVIRKDSHSHKINTIEENLIRCDEHKDILLNVINNIDMSRFDKNKYIDMIDEKYLRKKIILGFCYRNKKIVEDNYIKLKSKNLCNRKDYLIYLLSSNKILNLVALLCWKISKCFK